MRTLVAFDKFKDAITAREACEVTGAMLQHLQPGMSIDVCPFTDGGEGFTETLTQSGQGQLRSFIVTGPRGAPTSVSIGLVPWGAIPSAAQAMLALPTPLDRTDQIGVVEMASASGLALLGADERDPWRTTSAGTGELLRQAAALGARAILLGVGGSATNDLGLGALAALGLKPVDASDAPLVASTPAAWERVTGFTGSVAGLPPLRIACDVTNPLLGPTGCTAVFGPQKGLRPDGVARFEAQLARIAELLRLHTGASPELSTQAGMGAAGGITFGLSCSTDARLLPGFDLVSAWLDLERRIALSDLVITGEGRFDSTSLGGKGPGAIALRAAAEGKQVHVFAGQIRAEPIENISLHAVTPPGLPLQVALPRTSELLRAALERVFG